MEDAFDYQSIITIPNFQNLLTLLNDALVNSELRQNLATFEKTGYHIFLGPAGEGTGYSDNITIDASYMPVGPGNTPAATTQQLQQVESALTHELAHAVAEPGVYKYWALDTDPTSAVTDFLGN